jgi:predicted nucleotidyltransferase
MQGRSLLRKNRVKIEATEILSRDSNLKVICEEIVNSIPVESIILCGSRATNQGITDFSDYDLSVIMRTYYIPFYLLKLKKVEKKLTQRLGISVVINPLPTFRVKRAKGNLFLYKVKREGITIYGKDYIKTLEPGEIKDIAVDNYFSYLFSAAKDLIQNFDPRFLEQLSYEESKKILYDAAKAIIYCAELRLLLKGYYETKAEKLILRLLEIESKDFLEDLKISINIKNGNMVFHKDPLKFWFKARKHILETFYILMQCFISSNKGDIEALIQEYLNKRNGRSLKNFEYFALTFLIKKEIYWKSLFTKTSVEDRIRIALLHLILSIEKNTVQERRLTKAYDILDGYLRIENSKKDASWKDIKNAIMNYWPYACTVMGV